MHVYDALVVGAGQAGLSTSYHLRRRGVEHLVLDADEAPGGAWQHRWDSLTMSDVHGVADLPGAPAPGRSDERANVVVPAYFSDYERAQGLPVVRPVVVQRVESDGDLLVVSARDRQWRTRTLVNATGTWRRPFVPHYPGAETFEGAQLHTVSYPGPERLRGERVLVVGGGASAVQFLGELAPVTRTVWVTRRPPVWRDDGLGTDDLRAAVRRIEDRVRDGRPPGSIVSATGMLLRPQERHAAELGAYRRRPMFAEIVPEGVRWDDGAFEPVDIILWATGFRPAVSHLGPLGLRSAHGGIRLDEASGWTTAAADPRVQLVGYGPSASTIGANRAGRAAAAAVVRQLGDRAA